MKNNTEPVIEIFIDALHEMYWVEKYQLKFFLRMERAATTRYLKASFKGHFIATQQQVNRLEQVFKLLNVKAAAKKAKAAEEIIQNIVAGINDTKKETLMRDIALIDGIARVEDFEINAYVELISTAYKLGEFNVSMLLEENLTEEREAEETFEAIKEDTLKDELFAVNTEIVEEFEAVEE